MRHRSEKLLFFLTALVLNLNSLGLLLIPDRMNAITRDVPILPVLILGGAIFVLAIFNEAAIAVQYPQNKLRIIRVLNLLVLGVLLWLYFRGHFWLECLLLAALIAAHLTLLLRENHPPKESNWFAYGIVVYNLLAGILALMTNLQALAFFGWKPIPLGIGYGLAASAVAGWYALSQPQTMLVKILFTGTGIPWVIWTLALLINAPDPIPGLLLTISLCFPPFMEDIIPWNRILLPREDIIGKQAIWAAAIAEILMLIALAALNFHFKPANLPDMFQTSTTVRLVDHELAFTVMLATKFFLLYALAVVIITINTLTVNLLNSDAENKDIDLTLVNWSPWIARSIKPFSLPTQTMRTRLEIQGEQITALSYQHQKEKRHTAQLELLAELTQQLEAQLDAPVSAQLAVNTLQRAMQCTQVTVYQNDMEMRVFKVIAVSGHAQPAGFTQPVSAGILGRTLKLRKTQIVNEISQDADFIQPEGLKVRSALSVPLIHHGHVQALLEVLDTKTHIFNNTEVELAERVATDLVRAWERSSYHRRLTELIQTGLPLSPFTESQDITKEIASLARRILQARFTFVTLLNQDGNFSRSAHSGNAPKLLNSLNHNPIQDAAIQAALNSFNAVRIRDVRKYSRAKHITIDHNGLRSLLVIPIRLHRMSIGAILAFGKQGEIFFSENDESLANLMSLQAASAIEATWLYQEWGNTVRMTNKLYNLSLNIIRAESLVKAAEDVVQTTLSISNARMVGIVLVNKAKKIDTQLQVNEKGILVKPTHPMSLIEQSLQTAEVIHYTPDQVSGTVCLPLKTPLRKYGAIWLQTDNIRDYFSRYASNMQTLAHQTAVALERAILLVESRRQAKALEKAYQDLETGYDRTLVALMSALDARDRETEGHSTRVSELAVRLGEEMELDSTLLKILERGSLLHDIGKIGISDTILHKPGKLTSEQWKLMRQHPDIGAQIVEGIPFLQDTIPVIRYHQERWDGSGYPVGLSGKDIPLLARIFAVADAFDALISDRPYRQRIPVSEAMDYLREQAGVLFDPEIVSTFIKLHKEGKLGDINL